MLELPRSLSPSGIGCFTDCALHYKYRYIDRLEEPQTEEQLRGIQVHEALFDMYWRPGSRGLILNELDDEGAALACRIFDLEEPDTIVPIGLELKVSGTLQDGTPIRGIIDRLELLPDGTYCITDYKTGKAPSKAHLMQRMQQLLIYAYLVEHQLGLPVSTVQLLCLGGKKPKRVAVKPTRTQLRAAWRRAEAVWNAVEVGCATESFQPNPGVLCGWCSFRDKCPAGDAYLTARGK